MDRATRGEPQRLKRKAYVWITTDTRDRLAHHCELRVLARFIYLFFTQASGTANMHTPPHRHWFLPATIADWSDSTR